VTGVQVVHFVYVKHTFRFLGIGKVLLDAAKIDTSKASFYTHFTKNCIKVVQKYNMIYNPYLAFSDVYREQEKDKNEPKS